LPKPAAQASEGKIRLTTAAKQVFEANFPIATLNLSGNKLNTIMALALQLNFHLRNRVK